MFDDPFVFFALVIAIVALIFARKAMNQVAELRKRLEAIQAAPATAAAAVPPPLTPFEAFERTLPPASTAAIPTPPPIIPDAEPVAPIAASETQAAASSSGSTATAAAAARSRLRGNHRHPLGGVDRRADAGARRLLHGALFDRGRPDRPRRAHDAGRRVRAGPAAGRRMDPPQGKHLRHRSNADRQYPGHPDRGRNGSRVCHGLCGLCAVRLPGAGHRLHPARPGRDGHACRGAAARAGARRPRRRRRVRDADPGLVRQAGLLGALHLSRDRHRRRFRPGAHQAVALACGHHHRVCAAVDLPLPAMRSVDGRPACVPRARRIHSRRAACGMRLHVRPARRRRRDRADLVRLARGLSARRDLDRAEQFSCRHRDDRVRPAGGRQPPGRLAQRCRRRRGRGRRRTRLCRIRRMGHTRQSGHAGAARRPAAGHRAERHGRIGVAASDIGRDLRRRLRRRRIPGAGPLRGAGHSGNLVGRGRLHAAGAAGRALRPHRASRPLDSVCDSRGDAGRGLCRRDRDPRQARRPSGPAGLDRAVCDRHARGDGAGADLCAGKRLADDRAGADVGRYRLDFDAAADPVPALAGRHPRWIVVLRIADDPRIVGDAVGTTPIFNWLLWGYGIPAASFWAGSILLRRGGDDAPLRTVEAAAILFTVLLAFMEIRHAVNNGDVYRRAPTSPRSRCRSASRSRWRSGWSGCASAPAASFTMPARSCSRSSPASRRCSGCWCWRTRFSGTIDVGGAVINLLLLGYALPAVLALLLSYAVAGRRPVGYANTIAAGCADSRARLCDVRDPENLSRPGHCSVDRPAARSNTPTRSRT